MTDSRRPAANPAAATYSSKRTSSAVPDTAMRGPVELIELFCRTSVHGWKVSIMLEECGLPFVARPVSIGVSEQAIAPSLRIAAKGNVFAVVARRFVRQMDEFVLKTGQDCLPRQLAQKKTPFPINHRTNEVRQSVKDWRDFGGRSLIVEMVCWGLVAPYKDPRQQFEAFPTLTDWFERTRVRRTGRRKIAPACKMRRGTFGDKAKDTEEARDILFGQHTPQ